jgi:hypothetical protein
LFSSVYSKFWHKKAATSYSRTDYNLISFTKIGDTSVGIQLDILNDKEVEYEKLVK